MDQRVRELERATQLDPSLAPQLFNAWKRAGVAPRPPSTRGHPEPQMWLRLPADETREALLACARSQVVPRLRFELTEYGFYRLGLGITSTFHERTWRTSAYFTHETRIFRKCLELKYCGHKHRKRKAAHKCRRRMGHAMITRMVLNGDIAGLERVIKHIKR